ncbi:MAG: M28 family peptidase [Planctomycetota bacterium]|nr:MAG: M28 family peptidase [Planctomycetota bacterium]
MQRIRMLAGVLSSLLFLVGGQFPAPQAPEQRVSEARLAETVRTLVAFGPRMGGTGSGGRAAEWLEAQFRAAGLAVEARDDPEAWSHEATAWRVVAHVAPAQERVLERAWPWLYSPSAQGRARLSLEPAQGVALLAERASARSEKNSSPAVVLVDKPLSRDGEYPVLRSLARGDANKFPVFGISAKESALLREALAAGRAVEIEYELAAINRRARPRTVVAKLAARAGAAPGHVLLCAHGDSDAGGPGANDNASGVAIVLEAARALRASIEAGAIQAPARELRFAIWGSEIHSSRAYLAALDADPSPCLGVFNFDQSGYGSGAENLHLEPDDVPANRALVLDLAALLGERKGTAGWPARYATNKSLGGTDSYVFSNSARFKDGAIPALSIFTSAWDKPETHPRTAGMPGESWSDAPTVAVDWDDYYHSTGDTPANTTDKEPHNMGWCARVAAVGALRYAESLERRAETAPAPTESPQSAPARR